MQIQDKTFETTNAYTKFAFTHKTDTNTLLNFIAQKLTVSKNKAKQFLDRRLVFVNKRRVWIASYKLNKGDMVEVVTEKTQLSDSSSKHTGTRFQKTPFYLRITII